MSTVLITGASRGIGAALAAKCAAGGNDLVLVARTRADLDAVAARIRAEHAVDVIVITADLNDLAATRQLVATLGDRGIVVDVLVNNAGFGLLGACADLDLDEQLAMIQINTATCVALARLLIPGMIERGGGRVLNVASVAGFQPGPSMAVYHATKAFVVSWSRALGHELRGSGVTVTALCPGPVATGFQQRAGVHASRIEALASVPVERVARVAWKATQRGRAQAVPGVINRIVIFGSRCAPQWIVTRVAALALGSVGKA